MGMIGKYGRESYTNTVDCLAQGICTRDLWVLGFLSKRNGEVNSEIGLIKAKNTLAVKYFSNLPFFTFNQTYHSFTSSPNLI